MWSRLILFIAVCSRMAAAQGSVVSGVVHDSIGKQPLAGAVVQLVAADSLARYGRTATSDAQGRFTIDSVPTGKYLLGFYHPLLDSLGVQSPLRELSVDGRGPANVDLAIPSPMRLYAAICGRAPDEVGMIIGVVREARSRAPITGATVTASWVELSVRRDGLGRRLATHRATTTSAGWFALCNLPSMGAIGLRAVSADDSTGQVELQIPPGGFIRRELYVGPALARDGRISGMVVSGDAGRAVAGAEVSVPGVAQAITDAQGAWALTNIPSGTRVLEVRALGHRLERIAIDVLPDAKPIRAVLTDIVPLLDTVRVLASRPATGEMAGFEQRRRASGVGRFLGVEDIEKRRPIVTTDLFRMIPGMDVTNSVPRVLTMRAAFGGRCRPEIYVDGHYRGFLDADEIDDWASPDEVAGIEMYIGPGAPPQFMNEVFGYCGSVVVWTRMRKAPAGMNWRTRTIAIVGAAALTLLAVTLIGRD